MSKINYINKNIDRDKVYIPQLLQGINDEQLRLDLAHRLYTYAKRALFYKHCYHLLTWITIIAPAIVSIINVIPNSDQDLIKVAVTIASAITTVSAGILGTAKVHDHWTSYRSACEELKVETISYIEGAEPYAEFDESKRKKAFIDNMKAICKRETSRWEKCVYNLGKNDSYKEISTNIDSQDDNSSQP